MPGCNAMLLRELFWRRVQQMLGTVAEAMRCSRWRLLHAFMWGLIQSLLRMVAGGNEVQKGEAGDAKQQQGSHGRAAAKASGAGLPTVPPKLAFALLGDKALREKLKALSLPTIGKRPVSFFPLADLHTIFSPIGPGTLTRVI